MTRARVGACGRCGRDLVVRVPLVRTDLNVPCCCGHVTSITLTADLLAALLEEARHYRTKWPDRSVVITPIS